MEDIQPLITVCRHLHEEARDETVSRLQKQKHAAHNKVYRLQKKCRKMELTIRILGAAWNATTRHNALLNNLIQELAEQTRQSDE